MPKVSVIIPNYNHGRFLEKRIETVLNQTYQDFEIIFLDDASTDNSKEVFAKYSSDSRIKKAIFNQVNSGSPFKQWNKGVREAEGEYIWIAESDDYANEEFLEKLVEQLDNNPKAGLAYCQSWVVDENDIILYNNQTYTAELEPEKWKKNHSNNGKEECSHYLIIKNTIPNASAVLIRRSAYQIRGEAPEDMKLCGDWLIWSKILFDADIVFVAEPLNYFRTAHKSTVRNTSKKDGLEIEESFRIVQYIYKNVEIEDYYLKKALDKRINDWFYLAYKQQIKIPLFRYYEIYKILSSIKITFVVFVFLKQLSWTSKRLLGVTR